MADDRWRLSQAFRIPAEQPGFDLRRVVGRRALTVATHLGRFSYLAVEIVRGLREWRIWFPRAIEQSVHVGAGSLFIVLLTAAFAGGVTALQAGYQFTGNIPVYFAAGVIVESIILELGPVLTALILAGRVGARYAAELGTMRVTEQIDALESLGRSPISHLVIPRVIAGTLMMPVLVIFADVVGILSGYLASGNALEMSSADFVYGARYFFRPYDLWYSMVKAVFFGLAVTVVPCYMGFSTQKGAEGVGSGTTGAVVSSSVLILALDALLSQVLLV
ncbi:MAG: ABC transporter permease [Gemmatimonadales bacterium]|jgi:phospholipid/cholesterol/gamma-HCH transport system permease protein